MAKKQNSRGHKAREPLFVPDFDLLESRKKLPTAAEAAAIAVALHELLPKTESESPWELHARLASLDQRI